MWFAVHQSLAKCIERVVIHVVLGFGRFGAGFGFRRFGRAGRAGDAGVELLPVGQHVGMVAEPGPAALVGEREQHRDLGIVPRQPREHRHQAREVCRQPGVGGVALANAALLRVGRRHGRQDGAHVGLEGFRRFVLQAIPLVTQPVARPQHGEPRPGARVPVRHARPGAARRHRRFDLFNGAALHPLRKLLPGVEPRDHARARAQLTVRRRQIRERIGELEPPEPARLVDRADAIRRAGRRPVLPQIGARAGERHIAAHERAAGRSSRQSRSRR